MNLEKISVNKSEYEDIFHVFSEDNVISFTDIDGRKFYEDENFNRVYTDDRNKAVEILKTLRNCKFCVDCYDCIGCIKCHNAKGCIKCYKCSDITDSFNCYFTVNSSECHTCHSVSNVSGIKNKKFEDLQDWSPDKLEEKDDSIVFNNRVAAEKLKCALLDLSFVLENMKIDVCESIKIEKLPNEVFSKTTEVVSKMVKEIHDLNCPDENRFIEINEIMKKFLKGL